MSTPTKQQIVEATSGKSANAKEQKQELAFHRYVEKLRKVYEGQFKDAARELDMAIARVQEQCFKGPNVESIWTIEDLKETRLHLNKVGHEVEQLIQQEADTPLGRTFKSINRSIKVKSNADPDDGPYGRNE